MAQSPLRIYALNFCLKLVLDNAIYIPYNTDMIKNTNMIKTTIYLPEKQIAELKNIARNKEVSYALLIRKLVKEFIQRENKKAGIK